MAIAKAREVIRRLAECPTRLGKRVTAEEAVMASRAVQEGIKNCHFTSGEVDRALGDMLKEGEVERASAPIILRRPSQSGTIS